MRIFSLISVAILQKPDYVRVVSFCFSDNVGFYTQWTVGGSHSSCWFRVVNDDATHKYQMNLKCSFHGIRLLVLVLVISNFQNMKQIKVDLKSPYTTHYVWMKERYNTKY